MPAAPFVELPGAKHAWGNPFDLQKCWFERRAGTRNGAQVPGATQEMLTASILNRRPTMIRTSNAIHTTA
jgi:hypothetical protein